MSEFDPYSQSYEQLLDDSVRVTGETSGYFAAYKARFIAEQISLAPHCRILDCGCGVGLVSSALGKYLPTARVDGYDVSQASLDRIDPALRARGTFTSRIAELRRPYDLVLLANVLHHVEPQGRPFTVSQAAGLLGQTGRLVIFEHNPANPLTRRAVERCAFDENAILLPPHESESYLKQCGLQTVRLSYIVFFPHALRWLRALEPFLGWCPWGAQYAAVGSRA